MHSAALQWVRSKVAPHYAAFDVFQLPFSTTPTLLATVKAKRDTYGGRFAAVSQRRQELKLIFVDMLALLVDHSSLIGSLSSLLRHDVNGGLDAYLPSMFAGAHKCTVNFCSENLDVVKKHGSTNLLDTSSILSCLDRYLQSLASGSSNLTIFNPLVPGGGPSSFRTTLYRRFSVVLQYTFLLPLLSLWLAYK